MGLLFYSFWFAPLCESPLWTVPTWAQLLFAPVYSSSLWTVSNWREFSRLSDVNVDVSSLESKLYELL